MCRGMSDARAPRFSAGLQFTRLFARFSAAPVWAVPSLECAACDGLSQSCAEMGICHSGATAELLLYRECHRI